VSSFLFILKNFAKCSSIIMRFYSTDNLDLKYATVGFSRCGNVYLNRRFRSQFEHEWLTQTFHSAGMASWVSANGIRTIAIVRKPSECVLSNKVANPNLSIFSIYLAYILFLLRLNVVRNITIVDFEDVINDSDHFKTIANKFLASRGADTLPSAESVKISILNDKPQGGNPLHFSAPTKEKEQEKAIFRKKVQSHYFIRVADGLYFKLLKKQNELG
jgi:hypothetical protein